MNWLHKSWLWLAGLLVAIGLGILGRDGRKAEAAEKREKELMREGTEKALSKARGENAKATEAKNKAKQADEITRRKLDEVAAKSDNMADLLSSWNSHRVRDD